MKKILIIADKLNSGGVEVSLLNLIEKLKKDRRDVEITLLLMKAEGVYFDDFNDKCYIKEIEFKRKIYNKCLLNLYEPIKKESSLINKLVLRYVKLLKKINIKLYYKFLLRKSIEIKEIYDLVIDFHSYGYFGTCYGASKIKANNKILFIHDEEIEYLENVLEWIDKYNKIFCVSNSCSSIVKEKYPKFKKKLDIFHNIIPEDKIIEKSKERLDLEFNKDIKSLLTIGRLEYQKGYDILIDIAIKLKKEGLNFKWYIIGTGTQKKYIEDMINKNGLTDIVILLGMKKNPYPYLKQCNIYVQPSRHEGYGIAIAEARCLNKAIVASKLKCIEEQIQDKYTGILCDINVESFYKEIKTLLNNHQNIEKIEENLKNQKIKLRSDIDKIYQLL